MKPDATNDVLSITLPKNKLKFKYCGVELATYADCVMENDKTIEIDHDYNHLPTNGRGGYAGDPPIMIVDGTYRVFRHYEKNTATTNLTPKFRLAGKYVPSEVNDPNAAIVEWEFHLKNNRSSGTLTVNNPTVETEENSFSFTRVVALTDKMTVEPGKTSVYVFRADTMAQVVTYSLAYVY